MGGPNLRQAFHRYCLARLEDRLTDAAWGGAKGIAGEGVVIPGGNSVELVIVAARAGDSEAKERLGENVDHVVAPLSAVQTNVDGRMFPFPEEPETGPENRLIEAFAGMAARSGQK